MISLIVAMTKEGVIGVSNKMPWYYSEDLKHFKKITTGKTVLMGRKTFDSIMSRNGKILPHRHNVVLTRDKNFSYEGVEVIHDLEKYLLVNKDKDIIIIGGKEIYNLALPYCQRLYITFINKSYDGDIYFPEIDYKIFNLVSKKDHKDLSFCIYEVKKC